MSTKSDPAKKASLDVVLSPAEDAGAPRVIRAPRLVSPAVPSRDKGETYVVHCVDPERGLHLATPPVEGIVSMLDIDNASRVWIAQHRYHGEPRDEVLTMPLR